MIGQQMFNGTYGAFNQFGTGAEVGHESIATQDLKEWNGKTIPAGAHFRGNIKDFGAGPVALTEPWYTGGPGAYFNSGSYNQFVMDGSWVRLREITLNYSLNGPEFRKKTKLSSVDFRITGRNIFLWTPYNGVDPEVSAFGASQNRGIDYFSNPLTKSLVFTLKINY